MDERLRRLLIADGHDEAEATRIASFLPPEQPPLTPHLKQRMREIAARYAPERERGSDGPPAC